MKSWKNSLHFLIYPNFDSENIWFQVYSFLQIILMLHEYSMNSNWIVIHSNKRWVITTMIYDKGNTIINCLKMNIRVFHIQILILKMSIPGAFFQCKLFILNEYCTNFLYCILYLHNISSLIFMLKGEKIS